MKPKVSCINNCNGESIALLANSTSISKIAFVYPRWSSTPPVWQPVALITWWPVIPASQFDSSGKPQDWYRFKWCWWFQASEHGEYIPSLLQLLVSMIHETWSKRSRQWWSGRIGVGGMLAWYSEDVIRRWVPSVCGGGTRFELRPPTVRTWRRGSGHFWEWGDQDCQHQVGGKIYYNICNNI